MAVVKSNFAIENMPHDLYLAPVLFIAVVLVIILMILIDRDPIVIVDRHKCDGEW